MHNHSIPIWKNYYNWAYVLFMTFGLGVVMVLTLKQGYGDFENHFYQKRFLVENFHRLRLKIGDRVFPQVVVGPNRWLEYTSDGNLDDFQNLTMTDPQILVNIQTKLFRLNEKLKQRNIDLVVVVAPNKSTIYPENTPPEIQKAGEKSRLDSFIELMDKSAPPILLDLRSSLQAGRAVQPIYYKTDTHWNAIGAFIAYHDIMERISLSYPDLKPLDLNDFTVIEKKPAPLDLSAILGTDFLKESRIELIPNFRTDAFTQYGATPERKGYSRSWASSAGQDKSLLMYHDSFGIALQPLLQYQFREATYIQFNQPIDVAQIYLYNPSVVLIVIVERSIVALDQYLPSE